MGNENGRALSVEELKSREAQGNSYKLKVVIKGDRNTEYVPSSDSQFTHINWEYKASYDVVTVEIWDVVDKAPGTLKVTEGDDKVEEDPNVMRGVHAVVFMVDPTKKWTFDYVLRELPKIPSSLSTLLLANFKDLDKKWAVSAGEMRSLIESAGPHARYLEVSLANSFGLKGLQLFLNLPFLRLRHAFYEQQLKNSQQELDIAGQEFDYVFQESNYEKHAYLKWLSESKKTQVPVTTPQPSTPKGAVPSLAVAASPQKGAAPAAKSAAVPASPKPAAPSTPKAKGLTPTTAPPLAAQKSPPKPETPSSGGGFFSRLFGSEPAPPPVVKAPAAPQRDIVGELKQMAKKKGSDVASIDDFKPDVGSVDDFFGPDEGPVAPRGPRKEESSSDEEEENELVTRDEDVAPKPAPPASKATAKTSPSTVQNTPAPAATKPSAAPSTATAKPTAAAPTAASSPASKPAAKEPVRAAPMSPQATSMPTTSPTLEQQAAAFTAPARSVNSFIPSLLSSSPSLPAPAPQPAPTVAAITPASVSAPAPAPAAVTPPIPARPPAVDDFRPDDAGADDFFSSPAPAPAPKPVAKATPVATPAAKALAPAQAPAEPAPAPKQKFEESDSDDDKPNPFLIQDEDVGDDSVAVSKKAMAAELPKPTTTKQLAPMSWRQPTVEAKPAPAPQPKLAIDINALVAGFLQDEGPAPSGGFEAIPEDMGVPKKKSATKKKAAASASAEGGAAVAPKKKAGVKKKKAAAAASAVFVAIEDDE